MPLHAGSGMRVTEDNILAAIRDWYDPSVNQGSLDNGVLVPSAARTVTTTFPTTGAFIPPMWARGLVVYINITAVTGTTPTLTIAIQGVEPTAQSNVYTVLTSAALNAVGLTVLRVYPGISVAANVSASDIIPAQWSLKATLGGTTPSFTFSAAFSYEP